MRRNLLFGASVAALMVVAGSSAWAEKSMRLSIEPIVDTGSPVVYEDASGMVHRHAEVMVKNTGDVALTPGCDKGYSLSLVDDDRRDVVVATTPLEVTIEPGDSVKTNVEWSFPFATLASLGFEKGEEGGYDYVLTLAARENLGATVCPTWLFCYLDGYRVEAWISDPSTSDRATSLRWGFIDHPTAMALRVMAMGAADVTVTAIELPEGYDLIDTTVPFTVAGRATETVDGTHEGWFYIGLPDVEEGIFCGDLQVTVEGMDEPLTLPLSGGVRLPDSDVFFEGFEGDGTATPSPDYRPEGWYIEPYWTVGNGTRFGLIKAQGDSMLLANTYIDPATEARAITPRLTVGPEDRFSFEAGAGNLGAFLKVYWSKDRANWTLLKHLVASLSPEEGQEAFTTEIAHSAEGETAGNMLRTYVIEGLPEGDCYIAFDGLTCNLNNVYGLHVSETVPTHDIYPHLSLPSGAEVGKPLTVGVKAVNLGKESEVDGSYSVAFMVNGQETEKIAGSQWAAGKEKEFSFTFTPEAEGTTRIAVKFAFADGASVMPEAAVEVAAAPATIEIAVGEPRAIQSVGAEPFFPAYGFSGGQAVYPADLLASSGLEEGMTIVGLAYYGTLATKDCEIIADLSARMDVTDNEQIWAEAPADLANAPAQAYALNYSMSFTRDMTPSKSLELTFDQPYVYHGGNLIIETQAMNQQATMDAKFEAVNGYDDYGTAIYRFAGTAEAYATSPWFDDHILPRVRLIVDLAPAALGSVEEEAPSFTLVGRELSVATNGPVEVYTPAGSLVAVSASSTIDLSRLSGGIYVVRTAGGALRIALR